jgi:hypothetical protein
VEVRHMVRQKRKGGGAPLPAAPQSPGQDAPSSPEPGAASARDDSIVATATAAAAAASHSPAGKGLTRREWDKVRQATWLELRLKAPFTHDYWVQRPLPQSSSVTSLEWLPGWLPATPPDSYYRAEDDEGEGELGEADKRQEGNDGDGDAGSGGAMDEADSPGGWACQQLLMARGGYWEQVRAPTDATEGRTMVVRYDLCVQH